MPANRKRAVLAVLGGIAASLIIYIFLGGSPYALAIGCVVSVYLARPEGLLAGAVIGAVTALPLAVYIDVLPFLTQPASGTGSQPVLWNALVHLLLIVAFGGMYGLVFVWLNRRMTRGQKRSQ